MLSQTARLLRSEVKWVISRKSHRQNIRAYGMVTDEIYELKWVQLPLLYKDALRNSREISIPYINETADVADN